VSCLSGAAHSQGDEGERCFTLPACWAFEGAAIAVLAVDPGAEHLEPTDELVTIVTGVLSSDPRGSTPPRYGRGLVAVRFDSRGAGHIVWSRRLGDADAAVSLAGGWDITGDGMADVLVCISPRAGGGVSYAAGTLVVASASDGTLQSTTLVATQGLQLGTGIAAIGDGRGTSTQFLIAATAGDAAQLITFDAATQSATLLPLSVGGAGLYSAGLEWLPGTGPAAGPSIAVRVCDRAEKRTGLADSRVVVLDQQTHDERTLWKGAGNVTMCRAVPAPGQSASDVMIAEVREDLRGGGCMWLDLRRTSTTTGKTLASSEFRLDDRTGPGSILPGWIGVSLAPWVDLDGDGTGDYVCGVSCTCNTQEAWRALLVSGATGAQIGRLDDSLLAQHVEPTKWLYPHMIVPLRLGTERTRAMAVACGGQGCDRPTSFAVLDLAECLRAP
jgi:hypothetical protein